MIPNLSIFIPLVYIPRQKGVETNYNFDKTFVCHIQFKPEN